MNELPGQITSIASVIQLAIAPVFLLGGVGTILGLMNNRLMRVIDRFYILERTLTGEVSPEYRERAEATIISLARRSRLIHWAIKLGTLCILLVCLVIVILFIGAELRIELPHTIASLFVTAMVALIASLVCLLREINLSTNTIENLDYSTSALIIRR